MIFRAPAILTVLLIASAAMAHADDELLKSVPPPGAERRVPQPPPDVPPQARPNPRPANPPAAPPPDAQAKGEAGMMGLPWPKSQDEVPKTLENLYAFLATSDDHRQAGEIGAAIERLWRYEGGDTANLLIDRGEIFSQKNENDRAMPFLDAAVELAPDYAEAWSHRGYVEYRLNNYDAALVDLRRALALEPNHFRALDGMAKILTQLGERKAALKAYDQLLKVHPNIEGGQTARDELKKEIDGQGI